MLGGFRDEFPWTALPTPNPLLRQPCCLSIPGIQHSAPRRFVVDHQLDRAVAPLGPDFLPDNPSLPSVCHCYAFPAFSNAALRV